VTHRVHFHPNLIFSPGTHVGTLRDVLDPGGRVLHPRGVVVRAPGAAGQGYLVRFPDGVEEMFAQRGIMPLAKYKEGEIGDSEVPGRQCNLYERIIYRCVIGSRAYGLDDLAEAGR
jgi:uncharacterized protein